MNNPGQTHWANCATEGGPAHYECAVKEVERLRDLVGLLETPGALTVNCIRGTLRCTEKERLEAEITRLRALTTPQPIETAPRDEDVLVYLSYAGWMRMVQMRCKHTGEWKWYGEDGIPNKVTKTHWLPLPEDPK